MHEGYSQLMSKHLAMVTNYCNLESQRGTLDARVTVLAARYTRVPNCRNRVLHCVVGIVICSALQCVAVLVTTHRNPEGQQSGVWESR